MRYGHAHLPDVHDLHPGGAYWDISLVPIVQDGVVTGAVMSAVDVTSGTRMEEQLSESGPVIAGQHELLNDLIGNAPTAIALFNDNGELLLSSTEFERLVGSSLGIDDLSGPMFKELLRERSPNFLMELLDATIREKERVEANEVEVPRRDGGSIFCDLVGVPIDKSVARHHQRSGRMYRCDGGRPNKERYPDAHVQVRDGGRKDEGGPGRPAGRGRDHGRQR